MGSKMLAPISNWSKFCLQSHLMLSPQF